MRTMWGFSVFRIAICVDRSYLAVQLAENERQQTTFNPKHTRNCIATVPQSTRNRYMTLGTFDYNWLRATHARIELAHNPHQLTSVARTHTRTQLQRELQTQAAITAEPYLRSPYTSRSRVCRLYNEHFAFIVLVLNPIRPPSNFIAGVRAGMGSTR